MRVYMHARTLVLNRRTRARSCVHLSTFVSIACEKRREKRSALQRVVQILSDRSRRIRRFERWFRFPFPCAKRFISRLGRTTGDYSIAPAVRMLRFHKIAFQARNNAASRKDLSLESLSFAAIQNMSHEEFEHVNII